MPAPPPRAFAGLQLPVQLVACQRWQGRGQGGSSCLLIERLKRSVPQEVPQVSGSVCAIFAFWGWWSECPACCFSSFVEGMQFGEYEGPLLTIADRCTTVITKRLRRTPAALSFRPDKPQSSV